MGKINKRKTGVWKTMKVLNYGSLNIDYVYDVDHFVQGGETMASLDMNVFSGGKGLNQSVALGKSGVETYHAGAVGAQDGEFLLDQLKAAGVSTEYVQHTEGATGHAIIQKDRSGQNCILLYGGANQKIRREDVDKTLEIFEAGDYLVLQNEISENKYIMEKAHEKGMKIALNPSPMNEKILELPLEYVDMFLLNEVEAAQICGHEGNEQDLLKEITARFPKAVIILTLGGNGSMYHDEKETFTQPIVPTKVEDTTAAGDTFTGYLIGSLVRGYDAKTSMAYAAKAASIAVSRKGAAPSIPSAEEVFE